MLVGLGAQTPVSPVAWNLSPGAAEEAAKGQGKPILLLWQAGTGAPAFTQGVDRLFSTWPAWTSQVVQVAVVARGRSWESPLPPSFPPLPGGGKSSVLMVWNPVSKVPVSFWMAVPPALELSRRLAEASGRPLPDPYSVDVTEYLWEDGSLARVGNGPGWSSAGSNGPVEWVEEGPLGTVLVLVESASGRRAAFPLEGDWSFVFDPTAQSWSPWKPVLVKRNQPR